MVKPKFVTRIRDRIDEWFRKPVRLLRMVGFTANHLTFLQVPFNAIMFYYFIVGDFSMAAVALGITLLLDVLDGVFARVTKTVSLEGHFYDKTLDLIGIFMFLVGVYIAFPQLAVTLSALAILNVFIYWSNDGWKPEVYMGIRAFGFLGLLFIPLLGVFLFISLILGLLLMIFKLVLEYVKS